MKPILALLLTVVAVHAGEMVVPAKSDFKRPTQWHVDNIDALRTKLDLSKDDDRLTLERFEQDMYVEAMMAESVPFFRSTNLKKGDAWEKLWHDRQHAALDELASDEAARGSLEKAFLKLENFKDPRNATILERVVAAKFGGEAVWILLVHWERADTVAEELNAGREAILGHFLVIAVRASDQKIVSWSMCS